MNQTAADTRDGVLSALNDFYNSYLVQSLHGSFRVFQSFTYGEMTISLLLFSIFLMLLLHWLYEVVK